MTPQTVEKEEARTTVRFPTDLSQRLQEHADAADRSVNYTIVQAVEQYINGYATVEPPPWPVHAAHGLRYEATLTWVMPGFEEHEGEPGTEARIERALTECLGILQRWGAIGEVGVHSIAGKVPSNLPHHISRLGDATVLGHHEETPEPGGPTGFRLVPVSDLEPGCLLCIEGDYWVVLKNVDDGNSVHSLVCSTTGDGSYTERIFLRYHNEVMRLVEAETDLTEVQQSRIATLEFEEAEKDGSLRDILQRFDDSRRRRNRDGVVPTQVKDLKPGDQILVFDDDWMRVISLAPIQLAEVGAGLSWTENLYAIAVEALDGKTGTHIVRAEGEEIQTLPADSEFLFEAEPRTLG